MNTWPFRFARIGMAQTQNHRIMKRIDTTTRNLLLILAAVLTNCLIDGTMNLIVTICLCLALIPTARRMDRESRNQ